MSRCKCGCEEFYARQICYVHVVVDSDNEFIRFYDGNGGAADNGDAEAAIFDADDPVGPYFCAECGAVYESLDELEPECEFLWKVTNILWDVDDLEDVKNLPNEIILPRDMTEEEASDYISEKTGFLHKGFSPVYNTLSELEEMDLAFFCHKADCEYTFPQMRGMYNTIVSKEKYPHFDYWVADMLETGVFEWKEATV